MSIMIILGAILIIFFIYILMQYVLNEKQIYFIKYFLYVGLVMLMSVLIIPFFLIRPRHASNICLAALFLNPFFKLFGLRYRIENGAVFDRLGPCVIVANHQSSIDFIGMMHMWPLHILNCTILAKKEIFWALPFGLTAWLAGLEYVDRKNRQNSTQTMGRLTAKIPGDSLSVWIFPEGTRNMSGSLLPFKFGAFRLAIEAQVPIVPIVFSPYENTYSAEKEGNKFFWRHGMIKIRCLEPIDTTGMTVENNLQSLTDLTRQRMIENFQDLRNESEEKKIK